MDTSNILFEETFIGSKWFNPDYLFNQGVLFFQNLYNSNFTNWGQISAVYNSLLFFLGLFFITLMSYCAIRMLEIRAKEKKHLRHEIAEYAHHQAELAKKQQQREGSRNERWVKTLSYLFSQHASDWKLAVLEADAILESLLSELGFKGAGIGEKLKSADQEKFGRLTTAWEVHTIRNKIAHEGASFHFSQHEAKRVIALYEQIFRDFGYI